MSIKILNKIMNAADELQSLLEEFPEYSGYSDNELGKQALAQMIEDLQEIAYSAEISKRALRYRIKR